MSEPNSSHEKVVGVIGGLGPQATAEFFTRMVRYTPAKTDQEHLHILIDNNPKAPNRNKAIAGTGPSPAASLVDSAKRLQKAGAEILVMPCNTAHAFVEAITKAIDIPFINIVSETCAYIRLKYPEIARVGLLATDGCLQSGIYNQALIDAGLLSVRLPELLQQEFMQQVYAIKSTGASPNVKASMLKMTQQLIDSGAEAILAGCTEVPLVLNQIDLSVPLFDSIEILAQQSVRYAKGELAIEKRL